MTKEEFFAQLNEIDPADVKAMEKAADRQAKLAKAAMLCAVFTISRELSAYSIINRTPMQTSQYRGLSAHYYNEQGWPGVIMTIVICLVPGGAPERRAFW